MSEEKVYELRLLHADAEIRQLHKENDTLRRAHEYERERMGLIKGAAWEVVLNAELDTDEVYLVSRSVINALRALLEREP